MTKQPASNWDVFMAHAGPDLAAAKQLAGELSDRHGLLCFLDARKLRPGHGWPMRMKLALASSRIVAVLVSKYSDRAFYLQEEVAIAISIHRRAPDALRVVPVLRREALQEHLPYGTFALHMLQEDERGWPPIADALHELLISMPRREAVQSLANSLKILDDLWAGLERALTDKGDRMPSDYRMQFVAAGTDLISRHRDGQELQRVTREELDGRLTQDDRRRLVVLERSMEVNLALWETKYPNRVLDKRSRRAAEESADALAEDLAGVLDLVERAGLFLDDHYQAVRDIAKQRLR